MAKANQIKPFIPTLNVIRNAPHPEGAHVAEGFDAVAKALQQLATHVTTMTTTLTQRLVTLESAKAAPAPAPPEKPAINPIKPVTTPPSFDTITDGTNDSATMIVAGGAAIEPDPSSPGKIEATDIWSTPVDSTPPTGEGQALITELVGSTLVAVWKQLGITGIDCETSPGIPLLLVPGYLTRFDCDIDGSPLVEGDFSIVFDCGVMTHV